MGTKRSPGAAGHMELVAMLKTEHGMGHGHANAVVAHVLKEDQALKEDRA